MAKRNGNAATISKIEKNRNTENRQATRAAVCVQAWPIGQSFPRKIRREGLSTLWRRMAVKLAACHPEWTRVDVAQAIQNSALGLKKEDRAARYTTAHIMAAFKGLRFGNSK